MAVVGGEDVDTKGEQRLQGQEGQKTDQVWSPAVTFCTDTQYNSLKQALVSRDRHFPDMWGKRTKYQPYWTSHQHTHGTHARAHTHTHTHTHLHKVPGTHPLVGHLVQEGLLPLPILLTLSVGTGFGCGKSESHHTVSESRHVHATHTMHMNPG